MKPFTQFRYLNPVPAIRPSTLLGAGLGLAVILLIPGPAVAQLPSTEIETARSPEQETSNTNRPDSSEESEEQPLSGTVVQLGLLPFVPPPEEPAPENTLGGGRRNGQCIDSAGSIDTSASPQITALAPPPQIIGLTEHEKPTVWLYQPIPSVRQILLSVREEGSQQFHSQTTVDVPANSQWVPLQLADDAPPLDTETTYVWAAIALCGDAPNPNDPAISTRIRRVNPPSNSAVDAAPLALAETYARQGQWYDTVDAFLQVQQSENPNSGNEDLTQTWQALLDYAKLSEIAPPSLLPASE